MFKKIFQSFQRKSYFPFFVNGLSNSFDFATNQAIFLRYYCQVAPVGDAINKIAQESAVIQPLAFKEEKDWGFSIIENAFTKKLQSPNYYQTGIDFRKEGAIHYNACGNNYLLFTSCLNATRDQVAKDPLEIFNLRPDYVTIVQDSYGFPQTYIYSPNGNQSSFEKRMIKSRNGTYEQMFVNEETGNVLFHFKEPSNNTLFTSLYGDSPLQNVELEIIQYLQASVHNTNLLKNGMSARMLFSFKDMPVGSEDQMIKIKNKIETEYSGANNSGKSMFSPIPMEAKALDMNLKDMDFEKLMRRMRVAIYNKLNVPLPLVEGEFTSNTNMKEANLNFYDKSIIPYVSKYFLYLYTFPFKFLYKNEGISKIDYDISSVEALQTRLFENATILKKTQSITLNEIRQYQGFKEEEGGDVVYIDANQAPVAGDVDSVKMPTSIAQDANDVRQSSDEEKQALREIMSKHKDIFGKRLYTDEEIKSIL